VPESVAKERLEPHRQRRRVVEVVVPVAPGESPDGAGAPFAQVVLQTAWRGGRMVG
jgi:hypothetical protein